jgi:hypothetical protein
MVYTLTNQEKADIINQRLKNLESSKFHYEINLVEELAVPEPKAETVDDLQLQLDQINLKIDALLAELAKVE